MREDRDGDKSQDMSQMKVIVINREGICILFEYIFKNVTVLSSFGVSTQVIFSSKHSHIKKTFSLRKRNRCAVSGNMWTERTRDQKDAKNLAQRKGFAKKSRKQKDAINKQARDRKAKRTRAQKDATNLAARQRTALQKANGTWERGKQKMASHVWYVQVPIPFSSFSRTMCHPFFLFFCFFL